MKDKKERINEMLNDRGRITELGKLLVWMLCVMLIDWKNRHKNED